MTYKDKFKHFGCGIIAAVVGALVLGLMFSGCTTYWQPLQAVRWARLLVL